MHSIREYIEIDWILNDLATEKTFKKKTKMHFDKINK